jgi:hypothetical protein
MLDTYFNQATGLTGISLQAKQHVIAIASHGDWDSEMPLLWNLCSAWSGMSYPIVILDATALESDDNPGLQQLLGRSRRSVTEAHNPSNWTILPSARGLEQLCHALPETSPKQRLQTLGRLLEDYEIILIYADASNLADYLPNSGIEPLLPISMDKSSVLPAYQALKHLLLTGKLHAMTATVTDTSNPANMASARVLNQSLQDCALNFLGQPLTTLTVPSQAMDSHSTEAIKKLALRLLESATTIRQEDTLSPSSYAHEPYPPLSARSH